MKTKSTLLFSFIFMLAVSFSASGQQNEEQVSFYTLNQFATELQLTDQQFDQIAAAEKTYQLALDQYYIKAEKDSEYAETGYQIIETNYGKELRAILTDQQYAQLQLFKEDQIVEYEIQQQNYRRDHLRSGHWEGAELTDEQIEAIIVAQSELENNFDYTAEQDFEAALREVYRANVTEEQWAIYEAARQEQELVQLDGIIQQLDQMVPAIEAMYQYFAEESFPKYQELRNKLESKISAPDKVSIDALRTQLRRIFETEMIDDLRKGPGNFDHPEIHSRLDRMEAAISPLFDMYVIPSLLMMFQSSEVEHAISVDEIERLSKEYDNHIETFNEEMAALLKADAKKELEIFSEFMSEEEAKYAVQQINIASSLESGDERNKDFRILRNIAFLLLPIENESVLENDNLMGKEMFKVFPSPSKGAHTLELDLLTEDNITIELLNNTGKVIQVAHNGNLPEGKSVLSFDWGHLDGTIFYYRITGKHGVETRKFIISR